MFKHNNFNYIKLFCKLRLVKYFISDNIPPPYYCRKQFTIKSNIYLGEQYDETIIGRHPNLPTFLTQQKNISSSIPTIPSIRWSGTVYQESWKTSPKYLLYSAHLDSRSNLGQVVRIIALYDGETRPRRNETFCQLWFTENENPFMVPVYSLEEITRNSWNEDGQLNPYGISCKISDFQNKTSVPIAVSLVKAVCQTPSNILKISGPRVRKRKDLSNGVKNITIGICGKALFYYNDDFSLRLIEWIEIMKVLGVSKIFLYKMACHQNVEKVLDFYEKSGFVSLVTFYYPPPYVQEGTFLRLWTKFQKDAYRKAQSIYLNDCIMRNKDDFDYLGIFDSDEIPILRKHDNLTHFLIYLKRNNKGEGGFYLKWKQFYQNLKPGVSISGIPENFYILNHNQRTKLNNKEAPLFETNGKSIYNTKHVLWIGIHFPLKFISEKITIITVEREVAYTAHYGNHKCLRKISCYENVLEEEVRLLKNKNLIMERAQNVFNLLFSEQSTDK